ncbi:MAG: hypothetical protein KGD70_02790 [Candidatus Lokiarchaeota archaeon]|jgi:hypothetical protein|nr:hypothetical protein [Candidatus Lokiarchaeota archaeon]
MHINSHFAIGVILASILNHYYSFSLFEFVLVVFFSFICDFDIFFTKYAIDHNHRMLISHSIIPALLILIFGIFFNWPALTYGGAAYSIHVIIDTFDWGTNFFYFNKKSVGFKLLISKEEFENLPNYLSKFKKAESFFDSKYYNSKVSLGIEVILFILMMIFISIFAFEFILISLIYFLGLYFHLSRHFMLKKFEA